MTNYFKQLQRLVESYWILWLLILGYCAPSNTTTLVPTYQLIPVDESYAEDSLSEATIAPYRLEMASEMEVVIGHADKRLIEGEVESLLGNFVTDAILVQSRQHYSGDIHMSVITNGGLRAPIPQGPIKVSNVFEVMPFENFLYILELNSSQTLAMFDMLAKNKRVAVANSVVLVEDDAPSRIFIDGAPFNENQKYVLAVSDYLANGGGGMDFLKQARVIEKVDVKIRDLIIDHIKWLESEGRPVDSTIEGRVKIIP